MNIANGDYLGRFFRRIHVLPVGDVEIHAAQEICWCYPTETEPGMWVHHATDCREAHERVTGEKCSEGWINIAEYVLNNQITVAAVPKLFNEDARQTSLLTPIQTTTLFPFLHVCF